MSEVQKAMQTLTQQWYNAVVTGLSLDPNNFQLYQGTATTGPTSEWIWNIFDAIPPASINNFYNPNQSNNFSQDYQQVIAQLKPNSDNSFQICMGDYYTDWLTYLQSDKAPDDVFDDATKMSSVFKKWAFANAPDQVNCAASLIATFFNDVVTIANAMFSNAQQAGKGYAYNTTIAQLKNALQQAPGKSFTMNSKTETSNLDHTWAQASVTGGWGFFSFSASSSYDKLSIKTTTAGLDIDAKFSHVTTLPGGPLAKVSTDPILSKYTPWYNSSAFSRAYGTKDNTVWKNGSPSWDSTFGSDGNMQRVTNGLVVVDGIDITITSDATYSTEDQRTITAAASGGYWPFFSADASGGNHTKVTFSDSGKMTTRYTNPAGNPQLLGVLVTKTDDYI
ncbi:hypothetical protein BFR04_03235 [Gaetbulibacter sp. 4G1]|nr:hypothetical protein [Gaetbulibacter sp. 4G1]PIA78562.1 hypothetical protein BFR04_03235 [Gaetbulibacter sp. 4G1]